MCSTFQIVVLPSADGKRMELLIRSVTSEDEGEVLFLILSVTYPCCSILQPLQLSYFILPGIYQCFAQSGSSVVSSWASLEVGGAGAAAPRGVRCGPAGATAVNVRWPKLNADVFAYTVQITMPGIYLF